MSRYKNESAQARLNRLIREKARRKIHYTPKIREYTRNKEVLALKVLAYSERLKEGVILHRLTEERKDSWDDMIALLMQTQSYAQIETLEMWELDLKMEKLTTHLTRMHILEKAKEYYRERYLNRIDHDENK